MCQPRRGVIMLPLPELQHLSITPSTITWSFRDLKMKEGLRLLFLEVRALESFRDIRLFVTQRSPG